MYHLYCEVEIETTGGDTTDSGTAKSEIAGAGSHCKRTLYRCGGQGGGVGAAQVDRSVTPGYDREISGVDAARRRRSDGTFGDVESDRIGVAGIADCAEVGRRLERLLSRRR